MSGTARLSGDQVAGVKLIEFSDARAFLDYLRPSADRWWSNNNQIDYVFRGHSNEHYRLVPRAFRKAEKPSELQILAARIMASAPDLDEVSAHEYAITEVMSSFVAVAKSVGIHVGSPPQKASPYLSFELLALLATLWGRNIAARLDSFSTCRGNLAAEGEDTAAICVWALNKSLFGQNGLLEHISPMALLLSWLCRTPRSSGILIYSLNRGHLPMSNPVTTAKQTRSIGNH